MKSLTSIVYLAAISAHGNLVINGGFEDPNGSLPVLGAIQAAGATTFRGGSQFLGWVVGGDSVDIVGPSLWASAEGLQSLELNGYGPGFIYQDFNTTPGETYALTFALAANGSQFAPITAHVRVSFGGSSVEFQQPSEASVTFHEQTASFVATSTVSRLQFESLNMIQNFGGILDDVRLVGPGSAIWPPVGPFPDYTPLIPSGPAPGTPDGGPSAAMLGLGIAGIAAMRQRIFR